ncbi:MAG TPA: HAD hydrolase-like protein [Planctomycetota bacterium]|jgi:phosphoglycolate phosphatase|nr:HAD hydrolase-like protein [Planctomycetota bacterium]
MILEDVVIFDLDGTLVDSARLWCDATASAIGEVYARLGIQEPPPEEERLRAVIGTPAPDSLFALLPPHRHDLVPEVTEGVRRRGSEAMREGAPPLFPGARECLEELRRAGCAVAIATNAGRRYRDACLDSLGLRGLVDHAFCLDSPGVSDKGDMVAAILRGEGTRRAVLVGDRSHDRHAAHRNGIPFVAFLPGYGSEAEWVGAEGRVGGFGELLELLGRRGGAVRALADEVLRRADGGDRPFVVGVTGPPGSGKTVLAEDLARALGSDRDPVRLLRLDEFRKHPLRAPLGPEDDHLSAAFDLETFLRALARARAPSTDGDPVTLVEGLFLLDERVRPSLDLAIHLEATEEVLLRRLGASRGTEEARRARDSYLPAHAAFAAANHPRLADLRLEASNPLRLEPLP